MAEIDRRALARGILCCAAFATVGSVALTTPELAEAVPLAGDKNGPLKTNDLVENDDAQEADELLDTDDLLPEHAEQVQYWYRRRRRRRWWRRRVRCWWRRGRRVCVRRW
jgi:hypothetical protein